MSKSKSQKISGGQAAILSLRKEKTKHVFGLIGSATMEMFDALYKEKTIDFIGVRDERTGTHMADGYARASNKPGVILAGQNGPGATNLVTGIAQAAAAFSPVVSIAGSFSTKDKVQDAFQGVDQQSLFKPITKKTWTINKTKKIPEIFKKWAFKDPNIKCGIWCIEYGGEDNDGDNTHIHSCITLFDTDKRDYFVRSDPYKSKKLKGDFGDRESAKRGLRLKLHKLFPFPTNIVILHSNKIECEKYVMKNYVWMDVNAPLSKE